MVQLSLEELKSVLKLLKDKKRAKRKNKGRKRKRADAYYVGGPKSDSSHMQGYSQAMPFSNTSNQQTEIQHLQRNILENQIDRFNRPEVPNNLLTIDNFKNSMNLFGSQLGSYYDNRIGLLEDKANQFATDLNYGKSDLIKNSRNSAYIEQLPDDDDENIKPFKFAYDDGIDVSQTRGSDFFRNAGNDKAYEEDDPVIRTYTQSPMHETSLSDLKADPETPYFENTDIYSSKTPSVYFNKLGIEEEEDPITPKKSKGIIKKGIKSISKLFASPTKELEEEISTPVPQSNNSKMSTGTRNAVDIAQMQNFDTDWYKQNLNKVITIQATAGYPRGNTGNERFQALFLNLGLPSQEINNYLERSNYTQRAELYKKVYAKVRANNNKILKKETKEK